MKMRKKVNFFTILFIVSIVFLILNYNLLIFHNSSTTQAGNSDTNKYIHEYIFKSNNYQLVDPINISSWSDWANYPFITGNGSDLNPFIIENIEIIGTGVKTMQSDNRTLLDYTYVGIYIDANGSFIIRNCSISHFSMGIWFSIGLSEGLYPILEVEISDCSIGIYSRWTHFYINITNCYIHDCYSVSVKAYYDLSEILDYGGFGMWVRNEGAIENCQVEDCSFGMTAGLIQEFHNNELIHCGFVPDYNYLYMMDYDSSNTVNGKPIGMFGSYWGDDNLVFTQSDASQYGQLIFVNCYNLILSNLHITEACSIGIQVLVHMVNPPPTYLNDIICENQRLGLHIDARNIIANNIHIKNCTAGILFNSIRQSKFTKVKIDNTELPIIGTTPIGEVSLEIEFPIKLCFFDVVAYYGNKLHIEYSSMSFDVPYSFIPDLGTYGYNVQLNDTNTYQLSLFVPSQMVINNFTISTILPSIPSIPGYSGFWFFSGMIIGLIILIMIPRKFNKKYVFKL